MLFFFSLSIRWQAEAFAVAVPAADAGPGLAKMDSHRVTAYAGLVGGPDVKDGIGRADFPQIGPHIVARDLVLEGDLEHAGIESSREPGLAEDLLCSSDEGLSLFGKAGQGEQGSEDPVRISKSVELFGSDRRLHAAPRERRYSARR